MISTRIAWLCTAASLTGLLAGCGGDGSERASLSGTVTLDGQPIEKGRLLLLPKAGTDSPSAGAAIENGRYQIARDKGPTPGEFAVQIHASRKTGKKIRAGSPLPPDTMVDEEVEAVPARYNAKTTLTVTITRGANTQDFALESK